MKKLKIIASGIFITGLVITLLSLNPISSHAAPAAVPEDGIPGKYMTISGGCCFLCGLRTWCTMVHYPDLCTKHCQAPYEN